MHRHLVALSLCLLGLLLATPASAVGDQWPDEDGVVVIQRLPFERTGRWSLSPFFGVVPNDPFVTYLPVGLRIGHYFNESFLLELSGAYLDALTVDRDLRKRVGITADDEGSVALQDQQVARAQWSAGWTVLSAKARWFGDELLYIRGHLLAGFGTVLARNADDDLEARPEGLFGAGFEAHTGESTSVRVEIRQGGFQREGGGALFPTEFSLGLVWYPGGPLEGVR